MTSDSEQSEALYQPIIPVICLHTFSIRVVRSCCPHDKRHASHCSPSVWTSLPAANGCLVQTLDGLEENNVLTKARDALPGI